MRTRERCNRCGGRFEASDDAVAPVLRCRDCWREVPARALRPRPSRWRERLLLAVAVAIPASLAVAVAFGFPDPDAGSPPLRLRVEGEQIRAQVDTWQRGQMLCARLERDWPVELREHGPPSRGAARPLTHDRLLAPPDPAGAAPVIFRPDVARLILRGGKTATRVP